MVDWLLSKRSTRFLVCMCTFGKKKQKKQLQGRFTEDRLRGSMKERDCYAVDTVFPISLVLTDNSPGFLERCGLTLMNVGNSKIFNKVLFG